MINENKWINSLSAIKRNNEEEINQIDSNRWTNTISKKETYNSVKKYSFNSIKKYSLIGILFVCGLLFVSAFKNETRNLQKEINNLQASLDVTKFNLNQAILDNEVITSPENISKLAKKYLDTELTSYKKSQIKYLDENKKSFTKISKIKKEKINNKKNKNLESIKSQIAKRIEQKNTELKKLQELYSNPKSIPGEVAKKIKKKKEELKNIYDSPKDSISVIKVQRWATLQVVKAFLGMPIFPGK